MFLPFVLTFGRTVTVLKAWKAVEELDSGLQPARAKHPLKHIPRVAAFRRAKRTSPAQAEAEVEAQCVLLSHFLQALVSDPDLCDHDAVEEFFFDGD